MGGDRAAVAASWWCAGPVAPSPAGDQWDLAEAAHWGAVVGLAGAVWAVENVPRAAAPADRGWDVGQDPGPCPGPRRRADWVVAVDSSVVWAHQHSAGARKKGGTAAWPASGKAVAARVAVTAGEALGRSRGGLSAKIHPAVDGCGRPLSVLLSGGQAGTTLFAPGPGRHRHPRAGRRKAPQAPGSSLQVSW